MIHFTETQYQYIKSNINKKSKKQIAYELGISIYAVTTFCKRYDIKQTDIIRTRKNKLTGEEITETTNGKRKKQFKRKVVYSTEGPKEPNFVWAYNKLSDYGVIE